MTFPHVQSPSELAFVQDDMAYHQARVLLLVDAVCQVPGTLRKLDGLTKLAKLDFLVRYPTLTHRVIDGAAQDPRLAIMDDDRLSIEAPMIRYKYGPWDDRYYPVIGALVGRGLLSYAQGRRGSVALKLTTRGKAVARSLASADAWRRVALRCQAVAELAGNRTGNQLKDLIYERLPEMVDQPHREVIAP